jgi:hypothetical protein
MVIDLAEARATREVERRPTVGKLNVEWVLDDDGEPIIQATFEYDETRVPDAYLFLARYLPRLGLHMLTLHVSGREG